MNRTTKINILAYASNPNSDCDFDGDVVEYKGKLYYVNLRDERVEFIRNLEVKKWLN